MGRGAKAGGIERRQGRKGQSYLSYGSKRRVKEDGGDAQRGRWPVERRDGHEARHDRFVRARPSRDGEIEGLLKVVLAGGGRSPR